jgi:hypothetical protein
MYGQLQSCGKHTITHSEGEVIDYELNKCNRPARF